MSSVFVVLDKDDALVMFKAIAEGMPLSQAMTINLFDGLKQALAKPLPTQPGDEQGGPN